jgi:microcin C transport system ATP-binding protein
VAPARPDASGVSILSAKNLAVAYPIPIPGIRGWFKTGGFPAVRDVSIDIRRGETLGVVGESGSGKSTLALAALGLLSYEGDLRVDGTSWSHKASALVLRKTVQVVFQDPFSSLSPRLTVEEIVGEGLLVHQSMLSKSQRRALVIGGLQEVGLSEVQFPGLLERYPHEFSGGQRQRMAIARALVVEPDLLVLDEPTSALDVTIQKQVLQLLQRLQQERGLSYLLITHDMAVIRAMAHRIIVMRHAGVVEAGELQDVLDNPQQDYTRALIAASA